MEQPQPTATPTDGAAAAAEPVQGAVPPAATPPEPAPQGQPAQADQEYAAWLQSKGLTPDGEQAQKAAQMAYNAEKLMTKATQEASELKKSLTPPAPVQPDGAQGDPAMSEFIQDYRRDKLINGFKESHPDWNQHEPAMVEILSQVTPSGYTVSQLVNAGLMSLEMVYATAKGSAPVDTGKIEAENTQKVLQTLANTQRAGGGTAQASNANPQAPSSDPVTEAIRKARG